MGADKRHWVMRRYRELLGEGFSANVAFLQSLDEADEHFPHERDMDTTTC